MNFCRGNGTTQCGDFVLDVGLLICNRPCSQSVEIEFVSRPNFDALRSLSADHNGTGAFTAANAGCWRGAA